MRHSRAWSLVLAAALVATALRAQESLEVAGPEPAMIVLGETASVEIRVVNPQGDPREFTMPRVDGLRLRLSGPVQMLRSLNGASTRSLTWQIEIQPQREGTFTIPSFLVWTGTKEQKTRELRLDVKKELRNAELAWIEVDVQPQRVYVHEPIRVHVDAGVQQGVRLAQGRANNGQTYFDVEVQAPWLEEFPAGERIELPPPKGQTALMVRGGNVLAPATVDTDRERGGQRWLGFSFDRAFLPTRPCRIELPAPTLRYGVQRPGGGGRDVFGLPTQGRIEQRFVYGVPISIEVLPIPEKGRPTPYYGAVGRFTIDAALDRDTVKVNGSVKLTLTVRGRGNLEFLRLPALDAIDGFHKLGQAEAKRDADTVVVTYDLAPLSPGVRAVPAIEWNYFDTTPGVEAFATVATKPLPLQVLPLADGETLSPLAMNAPKAVTLGKDDIFDLPASGGRAALVSRPAAWIAWAAVLAPWALVGGLAWFVARRRRLRADVAGQRARRAARACEQALAKGGDALDAFAGYLGDRLGVPAAAIIAPDLRERLVLAGFDEALAAEVAQLVDRGTAARYGGGEALSAQSVRGHVQRLEGTRLRAPAWLPLLLLFGAAAATAGTLPAQTPAPGNAVGAGDPVALYRAGDFRGADAAFASAFEASGDRRLLQARGNCLFRLDDLPRALWAYESARLALPRDPELIANIALVRARLGLDDDAEGFVAQLERVRGQFSAAEQLALASACLLVAAACLVFGRRRAGLRWVGVLALLPGLWLATEQLVLAPMRPSAAIALQKLAITAEPRAGLEPVATVRPGVALSLLGGSEGSFVRVRAGERSGYAPRAQVAPVE